MYIIHYGELALKKSNRRDFERQLQRNIDRKLAALGAFKVQRKYGKFVLDVGNLEEYSGVALELFEKKIEDILSKTPGIHHFSKVDEAELTIESMKAVLDVCIARDPDGFESFRVTTKRTNKNFSMRAMELNRVLGEHIFETYKKRVDLRHPDRFFYVNIAEKVAYIYSKKQAGIGGLPIGSAGRVVSLLSGGIDSPVASFQLMKRGCEVIAIHAYAKTMDPEKVKEKVLLLAKKLAEVQASLQVYFIPYENIQKEIVQGADQKYRMLLFKRSIVRMANRIAQHVGAMAIVMGDAVGQVASQTLENIQCVYAASDLPVLSPLIAYDKQEIVDLAKKIGTYTISIQPHDDCCSLIAGDTAWTKGRIGVLEKMEEEIMMSIVEDKTMDGVEKMIITNG